MTIRLITDGAARGNPGPGGWAALLIYPAQADQPERIEELGGAEANTTNNRMELRAVIEGLQRVSADAPVQVITDSQYVVNGITKWLHGWRKRGWITRDGTPVAHRDLWETLAALVGPHVSWQHVRGHSGHPANERADTIAQAYAQGKRPPPPSPISTALADADSTLLAQVAARRPGRTTYLSLIGDQLMRHASWQECQARVHGVSGARFKKCSSPQEEITTVNAWGLPTDLLLS